MLQDLGQAGVGLVFPRQGHGHRPEMDHAARDFALLLKLLQQGFVIDALVGPHAIGVGALADKRRPRRHRDNLLLARG